MLVKGLKEIDIRTKEGLKEWEQSPITARWSKIDNGKVRRFIDPDAKRNPKHVPNIEFKHINYGFCTQHGFGTCPNDCKAITLNDFSPTAEAIFRKPNTP